MAVNDRRSQYSAFFSLFWKLPEPLSQLYSLSVISFAAKISKTKTLISGELLCSEGQAQRRQADDKPEKKKKAAFERTFHESYFNDEIAATGATLAPSLCVIRAELLQRDSETLQTASTQTNQAPDTNMKDRDSRDSTRNIPRSRPSFILIEFWHMAFLWDPNITSCYCNIQHSLNIVQPPMNMQSQFSNCPGKALILSPQTQERLLKESFQNQTAQYSH